MRKGHSSAQLRRRMMLGATVLLVAACAGNGKGLNENGQPIAEGGGPLPLTADFDSIQANIFTPICSVCHIGGGAPEGLHLDAANSYNLLVGVPSTEVASLPRVKPGDPANSYIIQKLQGHAAVGAQMPLGGPYLSADTIAFIQQWITNGAPPSASAASTGPLAITSMVPGMAESVSSSPPQIMIAFNQELDVSQIDAHAARIERLTSGGTSSVIGVVPARITVSGVNLRTLMIWPSHVLGVGLYRVIVHSNSSATFTDIAGQSITIGTPGDVGDSVVTTFDVETPP
jgi:hypothetical protein